MAEARSGYAPLARAPPVLVHGRSAVGISHRPKRYICLAPADRPRRYISCRPTQMLCPWPKRSMCIPQVLSVPAIYLFVGHPNHIPLGRSAVCIPLLVVAGIISHAVLSPPTGSCRSGQNAVPYLASTFYTRVGRDRLDRLERLNVQPYWSALSV